MRLLILNLAIFLAIKTYGQELPIAKVHYIFKHVNDTTAPDKFMQDEVATFLGQKSSFYKSVSGESMKRQTDKQLASPSFDGNLVIISASSPIKSSYIINSESRNMLHISRVASDEYILEDEFPVQEWQILDESKDIGGYNCQKAITDFKGRKYEAWFTTDLPFPFGPWKLHGLPGLILSAKDEKNEVSFEFDGFDKIENSSATPIEAPSKAIKANEEEVAKLEKAFKENPSAYMQSRSSARTISSGTSTISVVASGSSSSSSTNATDMSKIKSVTVKNEESYKPSTITNNPIELIP